MGMLFEPIGGEVKIHRESDVTSRPNYFEAHSDANYFRKRKVVRFVCLTKIKKD